MTVGDDGTLCAETSLVKHAGAMRDELECTVEEVQQLHTRIGESTCACKLNPQHENVLFMLLHLPPCCLARVSNFLRQHLEAGSGLCDHYIAHDSVMTRFCSSHTRACGQLS